MSRPALVLVLLVASFSASSGCKGARERCDLARASAASAFEGYVGELVSTRAVLVSEVDRKKQELAVEIEPRIAEQARARTDRLYQVGSDAWVRGYHVAQNDLCMKDRECSSHKHRLAEAQAQQKDLDERLSFARAALTAIDDDLGAAHERAGTVILDPERPSLKAAQQAVLDAHEQCKDVPPEEPE